MIEIKAKNNGEDMDLSIRVSGKGKDIVPEAIAIMMQLPKNLMELDDDLFGELKRQFADKIEQFKDAGIAEEEVEHDRIN